MLFTSILFISIFLPLFLITYYVSPNRRANGIALGFSLVFYFWGAPRFLPVVLVVGAINYLLSLQIQKCQGQSRSRFFLTIGIALHLGILFYYKYLLFFLTQWIDLAKIFSPAYSLAMPMILLPLGVSFITFEQISYLMDVYRGECRPAKKLSDYYLFLLFFPHSIAGPIFRWRDLEGPIESRQVESPDIEVGFLRFIYGLGKKVLIANYVAFPADQIFSLPSGQIGFSMAWLGSLAYTLQIYFDFSAYSDMAIGLGKMVGFNFKENFDHPYRSRSVTEFWQRWHISLTSWFRSYLYIPLGGNRVSLARNYCNIILVFAVSGFWHGASWNFLVWGIYFGVLIVTERALRLGTDAKDSFPVGYSAFRVLPTLFLVLVGWIFFRANNLPQALDFLRGIIGLKGDPPLQTLSWAQILPWRSLLMMVVAGMMLFFEPRVYQLLQRSRLSSWYWVTASSVFILVLASLANSTYNPFIYFRF